MFSGSSSNLNSTMHLVKKEKDFLKEKEYLQGYPKLTAKNYKADKTNPSNKKGFVRLDSLEDYEVIDFDMVKDPSKTKPKTDSFVDSNHQNIESQNKYDSRYYHPAGYKPPPYSYSNCHTGMNSRLQQLQKSPISDIAVEASKLANQFIPWHNSCQTSYANHPLQFATNLSPYSTGRSGFTAFEHQSPSCDIREDIVHHVPFNLSTGQYEYWMSMPSSGGNNYSREAMQAYCSTSPPNHRFPGRRIPAQISKSVSSWVGGLYNWVASSVDSALKPNFPISSDAGSIKSEKVSNPKPLNPNAKEFTPQITLNPNAKEFQPSKMVFSAEVSKSIPASPSKKLIGQPGGDNLITITCTSEENLADQTRQMDSDVKEIGDVLNESDSDLSQLVIEQLIKESNEAKKMETSSPVEHLQDAKSKTVLSVPKAKECGEDSFQLKSVTARKTTPWINLRTKLESKDLHETPKSTNLLPPKSNNQLDDEESSDDSDVDNESDDESDDDFVDEISLRCGMEGMNRIRRTSSRKQSSTSSCDDFDIEFDCSRMRSLSVCSDESNFIEFGTPPTSEQENISCDTSHVPKSSKDKGKRTPEKKLEKSKRCLLKTFVVHAKAYVQSMEQDTDTNETDEEHDSDDDPDWDEVDGEDDIVDDPLWQSFQARVLVCPMSTKETQSHSTKDLIRKESSPPAIGIISIDSIFIQDLCDSKPANESGINPTKKSATEIREANEKWDSFYQDSYPTKKNNSTTFQSTKTSTQRDKAKRHVTIAPVGSFVVIFENPEESEDLRKSRNGDYSCDNLARRKADKDRMEKLMAPIFKSEHRQQMWDKIQTGAYANKQNI